MADAAALVGIVLALPGIIDLCIKYGESTEKESQAIHTLSRSCQTPPFRPQFYRG